MCLPERCGRLLEHVKLRALQILLKWGVNPPAKSYLELGGKVEGELQTSRDAEEEEDTDGDEVVELLNVSDSEGSLRSQYLD
ncbi:hypothetical protein ABG768_005933 [Culter alburnus]|uniref:Uncharacterized protein n=1 Tax=Culter alburnus TaxID=194366 RepID=A0AAW1ZU07_CULAL